MTATSKGTGWELRHSIWILWTFTLGFFNWIAFFYVGIRARQRKWILWGLVYSIPFILSMLVVDTSAGDGPVMNLVIVLQLILAVVSLIHAFMIRKEYLMRLEALQARVTEATTALKSRIQGEVGTQAQSTATGQANAQTPPPTATPEPVGGNPRPPSNQHPPATQPSPTAPASPVDLNDSSERELATLPGVGLIVAKRAVALRQSQGPFRSVEDFGEALNLKPHVVERIRPLVAVPNEKRSRPPGSSGRRVDF